MVVQWFWLQYKEFFAAGTHWLVHERDACLIAHKEHF
jgi:hypothetical protein